MTQEEKELLLKDLCARLPYGVKAKYYGSAEECECYDTIEGIYPIDDEIVIGQYGLSVGEIKPYLFPLSSMTDEQKKELRTFDSLDAESTMSLGEWAIQLVDFYNKYHLDYRDLIPKGLAIDATGKNIY